MCLVATTSVTVSEMENPREERGGTHVKKAPQPAVHQIAVAETDCACKHVDIPGCNRLAHLVCLISVEW